MDIAKPFLDYLRRFVELTETEFDQYVRPYIIIRKFNKKDLIARAGEVEHYFNFIISGLARKYYKKGKNEITTQISFEGHIMHCQESFFGQKPSEYTIEALEPVTMISISFKDLESFYRQSQKTERLGRLIFTHMGIAKDRWQMLKVRMKPRELFLYFVQKHPEIIQRVPQKYVASYLNIKAETYSRFKHLLRNNKKKSAE